jgi:hypothetical protein
MTRSLFIGNSAIKPRRRVIATAIMYGLSLSVRLTSATGEEAEMPAQAGQGAMTSILINDNSRIDRDWLPDTVRPMVFLPGGPLDGACRGRSRY